MKMQENIENLTIGLCDDEQHIHHTIEKMLLFYAEENHITMHMVHYTSAKQLIDRKDELDVLLLDIEMPDMDGIEAGYRLLTRKIEYKIIMLTAREERYKEAFKIGAFRFVPKPIDKKELYNAIDDVREYMMGLKRVTVFRDGVSFQIAQQDILYIEANKSATLIFSNHLEFRSEQSLAMWINILDKHVFFQCHKSYIVNMGKIDEIEMNVIRLINGEKVAVSRRLRSPLIQAFIAYDTRWR